MTGQTCDVFLTLSLDGIEVSEEVRVQLLVVGITQCGDGQWLQVQQFRGRGELLGEDEVAEGHRELSL